MAISFITDLCLKVNEICELLFLFLRIFTQDIYTSAHKCCYHCTPCYSKNLFRTDDNYGLKILKSLIDHKKVHKSINPHPCDKQINLIISLESLYKS